MATIQAFLAWFQAQPASEQAALVGAVLWALQWAYTRIRGAPGLDLCTDSRVKMIVAVLLAAGASFATAQGDLGKWLMQTVIALVTSQALHGGLSTVIDKQAKIDAGCPVPAPAK